MPGEPEDIIEIDEDGKVCATGPRSVLDLRDMAPAPVIPAKCSELNHEWEDERSDGDTCACGLLYLDRTSDGRFKVILNGSR